MEYLYFAILGAVAFALGYGLQKLLRKPSAPCVCVETETDGDVIKAQFERNGDTFFRYSKLGREWFYMDGAIDKDSMVLSNAFFAHLVRTRIAEYESADKVERPIAKIPTKFLN